MNKALLYLICLTTLCFFACDKKDLADIAPPDSSGNDGENPSTALPIPPNTIVFNVQKTDGPKFGQVGFLGSVTTTAPVDEFILPLKPYLWRVGRFGNAYDLYERLDRLGVERKLLLVSDFRNTSPTNIIFEQHGYGALADTMARRAVERGYTYEWDIFNEPNDSLKNDLDKFMTQYWNPAYKAIRKRVPDAIIHGPSTTFNNFGDPKADSALMYTFIDEAIKYNTLPDYINWHFQIGYDIADWHEHFRKSLQEYIESKGASIKGIVVGETIRPGNERNTSPGVAVDVFAAAEVYKIPQIRASWTSQPVYDVQTYTSPVLGGLFNNTDGTGRRGIWWTHEFYGRMDGLRIVCENSPTGSEEVVGIAFRDDAEKKISAIIATRDGLPIAERNKYLELTNIDDVEGLVANSKVRIKVWDNRQTKESVSGYSTTSLPLVLDKEVEVEQGRINILLRGLTQWNALLIEITRP